MHPKDNTEKHARKIPSKKLPDPFAELFAGPFLKTQTSKDTAKAIPKHKADANPSNVKSKDDILFSKIDPLDLSLGKNKPGKERGSIVFDEDAENPPQGTCSLRNDPILSTLLSKTAKKTVGRKKRSQDAEKTKQELLSLLSAKAEISGAKPEDPGLRALGQEEGDKEFIASLFSKDSLIETPKSPNIDQLLASGAVKAAVSSEEGKGFSFTFGMQGKGTAVPRRPAVLEKQKSPAEYQYRQSPQMSFRQINWEDKTQMCSQKGYIGGHMDAQYGTSVQYSTGNGQHSGYAYYPPRQARPEVFHYAQQPQWGPPPEGQWVFMGQQARPCVQRPLDARRLLRLQLKLFTLKRMDAEHRHYIESTLASGDKLKYRFSRTMTEIARVFGLPRLRFSEVHELRLLHNLFSRYGGYLSVNAQFLNHIKDKMASCLFRYLSYVLPFETGGYFYRGKSRPRTRPPVPTKEELNLVLCIGIYDDIFHFLELLEQGDIPVALIGELLNAFFLVSESLLKKFEICLQVLNKLVARLAGKPYRVVLERIPRRLLYELQELLFRVILKFERRRQSDRNLHEDTLNCIIEVLMERRLLRKFKDISELDRSECERAWVLALVDAVNTTVRPTPAILEALFDTGKPGLAIKAAVSVHLDRQALGLLFSKHEAFVLTRLEQHAKTLEMLTMLDDNGEFESIVTLFLPFVFSNLMPVMALLNTVIRYRDYLLVKRVYFRKRGSSNIEAVIRALDVMVSGGLANCD